MPTGLSQRDMRAVLDFVAELHVLREPASLIQFFASALPRLIPSELAACVEYDPASQRVSGQIGADHRLLERFGDALSRHMLEHPALPAYAKGAGAAARISDYVSPSRFRRSALYNEVFRPMGMQYQLAKGLPVPGARIGSVSVLRRGLEFSERDSAMLSLLRTNLNQAYRNAETYATLIRLALSANPAAPRGERARLSARETEVLIWAAQGRRNRDIGSILGISALTVKKHLENIYGKLGAANRIEAVRLLSRPAAALQ